MRYPVPPETGTIVLMELADLSRKQVDRLRELCNRELGDCYVSFYRKKTVVAICNNLPVGFVSFSFDIPPDVRTLPGMDAMPEKTGYIAHLAVASDCQRRGVGTLLLQSALDFLQTRRQAIAMVGWESPPGVLVDSLALKAGFSRLATFKHFWTEDSLAKQYSCPACGVPCLCSAAVYLRSV